MSPTSSILSKYGIAVVAIAVAILIRAALTPWMGQSFPLATMFSAVAFVVWYGGWGPALLTTIGGWFAAGFVFRGGQGFVGPTFGFAEMVGLAVYTLSNVSVIVLGEAMRAAQRRLQYQQERLSTTNLALENKVEAQSLLAAIVASSDDAIISQTLDGRITSWNKGAERLYGYSAHEAIGKSIHLIVSPEGREEVAQILDRIRHGERVDHLEVERVRKDGERVSVSITVSPVHDRHGLIIGASKTARDISARKQWEANRERSEEALKFAMSAGRMGAWSRDLTLDDIWWSPELAALFGFDPNDVDYSRERLFRLLKPEDRTRLTSVIEAALARHEDYALEFQFRHAQTGEWRWMEARGRAHYDPSGRPTKLYGLGIDITDRVRAVEALREADRRKDEFLATLAHELRNPLAPIASGLHILRTAGENPQVATTAREIMERQVAQMVRLVDDLLDVARITTGKVELRCEPLALADAVKDAVETSRPLLEKNGQPLTVSLPDTPVHANADRTRLAQVFANLLNNSAKFSDRGQPISIALAREGDDAVVRVRDAGVGIAPDALPKIFDMFGQADGDGSRKSGGLGIGLSLVKRIAEMHGGSVAAHSAGVGRGSEFVVRIPAIATQRPAAAREERAISVPMLKRRILVVDDNTDAAESLAALLSINGHETRLAHDGLQAVEEARAFQPDVVFLDIGMPTVDGHETARRIRQEPWGKNMVLVALTGWGQSEDRRRSQEAGFNHHLVKPADPTVVAKLISSLAQPNRSGVESANPPN
jgi:PAS domain S-box-containing protein